MKYVSIDIETTGLDPKTDQILEIAFVIDELGSRVPVEELPSLRVLIRPTDDRIAGNLYAIVMNSDILAECLASGLTDTVAGSVIQNFLNSNGIDKVWPAGKNFGSFDKQFINANPAIFPVKFAHRSFDPALSFTMESDQEIPNLSTCLERAGLPSQVLHRALDDARDVVRLIRHVQYRESR